jgi:hypothetical protein
MGMSNYRAVQNVDRPKGDWTWAQVEVQNQAQLDRVIAWIETKAVGPVDVFVHTREQSPRRWRLGCYGWQGALPVDEAAKMIHHMNINAKDRLDVGFLNPKQATMFKLSIG